MKKKEKKYHYIYKTVNLINQKFYVGMHNTNILNDGYLGSGTILRRSIRKYGKDNFILEILEFLPDNNSLSNREREIVNEIFINDPLCINLKPGGCGGFCNEQHRIKFFEAKKQIPELKRKEYRKKQDTFWRKNPKLYAKYCSKLSLRMKGNKIGEGRKLSDDTKNKIGSKSSIHQTGIKNSQFGTCWITNGILNKKIKKIDFHLFNNNGWYFGRTLK